jgi:oligopeptidase B
MQYLEAENAYTAEVMKPTEELQELVYREIRGRIKESDRTVPVRIGPYDYYTRTVEGRQYSVHCRRPAGSDAEQVILDENELARELTYFRLGALAVSPDHKLLAYSFDRDGGEKYVLCFKNLETGERLEDTIRGTYTSVEWAADSRTVFYNTLDETHRPYRLYRHSLGRDPAADELVFQEDDASFFLGLYKTKSKRFLMLELESNTTSEVLFLEATRPRDSFRRIEPRVKGVEYTVEHNAESFLILTNDNAVNFKIVRAPVADPARRNWIDFLPHREQAKLDEIEVFAKHIAVVRREKGLRGILVIEMASGARHEIEFPEAVYTTWTQGNPEFETETLRFGYTSLVTPSTVFDYDMKTRGRVQRKQQEVVGGYDPEAYACERVLATAPDGTAVPISLVYRKDLRRDGAQPLLLYGYGSYGSCVEPSFSSGRLSLLDRGLIYAIAHVRGGGEMGRPWYEAGKLRHKPNTFTDFIACAEHLISTGYTTSRELAIFGGSAGGLLMGAVTNLRPDLFQVVVASVPFVDVVNTMLDPSIPLTVIEWEEWGDPRRREDHETMISYSPYDNVTARDYPHLLILAGLNDPRVAYWEPAKWAAKLRALKTDDNLLLLKTNLGAGHGGPSGRYERMHEAAFEYAFILDRLKRGQV